MAGEVLARRLSLGWPHTGQVLLPHREVVDRLPGPAPPSGTMDRSCAFVAWSILFKTLV